MHFRAQFIVLLFLCWSTLATDCRAEAPLAVSQFLTNMPQNSNKRCVGIAGVAEALVEGQVVANLKTTPAALAREIYQNFTTDKTVNYPSHLNFGSKQLPIDDNTVLEALSTRVANLYKADYQRLSRTQAGINRLIAAQNNVVRTTSELAQLLNADPDKTGFFCCFGKRLFPDAIVSDTSHAVLIQAMPHDVFLVYDPNDPGTAIECQLKETPEGLLLTWQCQYRDKKVTTKQSYLIVPQARFFHSLQ